MRIAGRAAVLVLVATLGSGCSTADPAQDTARQSEVAARGSSVMPFDLERTTHRFTPRDDGLLQEVFADQPGDTGQAELIRRHLADEAARFRRGDFADPAQIHGEDMPGLRELAASAGRISIDLAERADGASLTFRATDPVIVRALHLWGEAQVSDHGSHAEHGGR